MVATAIIIIIIITNFHSLDFLPAAVSTLQYWDCNYHCNKWAASQHRWIDELSMSVQRCYKIVSNNQPAYKTRHEKIAKINRINIQKRQTSLKLSWNWTSLWHCINRQNTPTKQCNEKMTIHCIHREYLTIKTMSSLNYHASGRKRQRRQEKNTSKLYRTK